MEHRRPLFGADNSVNDLWRTPVIAWLVEVCSTDDGDLFVVVTAITANGSIDDGGDRALQFGDGPFITVNEEFDQATQLLAHFEGLWRRRSR
jgi:hypothetical protein